MQELVAGQNVPWKWMHGHFTKVVSFTRLAQFLGEKIGESVMGTYGFVDVELPNPDVSTDKRVISLPIKNKSDYRSLHMAYTDRHVKDGSFEVHLGYEHRRTLLGGFKPCFHIAVYPVGTWQAFYDLVDAYRPKEFTWPKPLFMFQPSNTQVFPMSNNIFKRI